MVETVLLVRHGKAQSRDIDIEDAARSLTEAGKRSLRAVYPRALGLLDSPRIHIWTSPKIRARQTADIVADVLGVDEIDEHPSLAQDSIDEFLAELRKDEQKTVVAVGHEEDSPPEKRLVNEEKSLFFPAFPLLRGQRMANGIEYRY